MAISMYGMSVPVFKHALGSLDKILDKAVAYADSRKIEHETLLKARLAPDMLHLIRQVQIATDHAKGCVARLAGVEPPKYEDNEASFADLKARIAKTVAYVDSFKPAQIDGSEDRDITLKLGPTTVQLKGMEYLRDHAVANVYFHYVTAYGILRHNGLAVGKRDFMGAA